MVTIIVIDLRHGNSLVYRFGAGTPGYPLNVIAGVEVPSYWEWSFVLLDDFVGTCVACLYSNRFPTYIWTLRLRL